MVYKWKNEALEKYGEEITLNLIQQQKRYEEKNHDNDCEGCGINNEGTVIDSGDSKPYIMHYGNFSYSNGKHRCRDCGKRN